MSAEAQIVEYSLREEELHQLLVRAHNGEDPEKLTTDWCASRRGGDEP